MEEEGVDGGQHGDYEQNGHGALALTQCNMDWEDMQLQSNILTVVILFILSGIPLYNLLSTGYVQQSEELAESGHNIWKKSAC